MNIDQFVITRALSDGLMSDGLKGKVEVPEKYFYEVRGLFGTGFKINVDRSDSFGELVYFRDASWGEAKTDSGRYEIHVNGIATNNEPILETNDNGELVPISDKAAMALFIVYFHFWNKTGPFKK